MIPPHRTAEIEVYYYYSIHLYCSAIAHCAAQYMRTAIDSVKTCIFIGLIL